MIKSHASGSILQRLNGARQGHTLAQLVDAIPAGLTRHPRTVRRDLAALESSHFPLLTERIEGEVRWRLLDGFKNIPALRLSPTELMALAFRQQLLTPLQGTLIAASLNSALTKINAAIPAGGTDYLQRLDQWFSVGLGPHKNYRHHRETIDILSQAIAHRHTVQMRYFSAGRNATTRREATLARLLGKQYKVLLVDKGDPTPPTDVDSSGKCCGGLLAPDAQKMLAKMGLGVPQQVLVGPQLFAVRTIDVQNRLERYSSAPT